MQYIKTVSIRHSKLFLLYIVPAGLYCVYNNLLFVTLMFFDPTSTALFMQIRLVMTGVIYQVVFRTIMIRRIPPSPSRSPSPSVSPSCCPPPSSPSSILSPPTRSSSGGC